jgi:hypothetical protein
MRLERTEDVALISSIINHPEIKPHIILDGQTDLPIPIHPSVYHLIPKIDVGVEPGMIESIPIGIVMFFPVNPICWNPHVCILPQYRGMGTEALMWGIEWMFSNTECKKLIAHPPVTNTAMIQVFKKLGFHLEGVSPKSVMKNGELVGRILYGLEKEYH